MVEVSLIDIVAAKIASEFCTCAVVQLAVEVFAETKEPIAQSLKE